MFLLRVKNFLLAVQVMCLSGYSISKAGSSQLDLTQMATLFAWDSSRADYVSREVPLYVRTGCLWWAGYSKNPLLSYQNRPSSLFKIVNRGYNKAVYSKDPLELDELYSCSSGSKNQYWKPSYYCHGNIKILVPG